MTETQRGGGSSEARLCPDPAGAEPGATDFLWAKHLTGVAFLHLCFPVETYPSCIQQVSAMVSTVSASSMAPRGAPLIQGFRGSCRALFFAAGDSSHVFSLCGFCGLFPFSGSSRIRTPSMWSQSQPARPYEGGGGQGWGCCCCCSVA